MALRCSLLGHDYGDSFVERDREERGNEVVVTERELKECARCGAEKVTTENTEVRSLQAGGDATDQSGSSAESSEPPSASASDADTPAAEERASADADDGASASAFSSPADAIEQAEADATTVDATTADATTTDDAVTADADTGGEDAVILDDDADDGPGSDQWDEPEDVDPDAEPEPTPSTDDEDVEFVGSGPGGADVAASADDHAPDPRARPDEQAGQQADAATGADSTGTNPDRGRGEWPEPESADDEGFDAAPSADAADATFEFDDDEDVVEADTGFTSAGPLETADRSEADDLDYTLYCPECGLERYAGGSSLRAGDICPECKKGYLAEDR